VRSRSVPISIALTLSIGIGLLACSSSGAPSSPPTVRSTPVVSPHLAPVGPTETARVIRIVDGDTIVVDRGRGAGPERLRYIGIDAPESVAPDRPIEWMGPEAAAANARLVEDRDVLLERDVSEVDRFGRLLRYVWVADPGGGPGLVMVNLVLVAQGYAAAVTYPPDVRYTDILLAAQAEAREAGRGLWGPAPSPRP
jgi:micrococcal nuclease